MPSAPHLYHSPTISKHFPFTTLHSIHTHTQTKRERARERDTHTHTHTHPHLSCALCSSLLQSSHISKHFPFTILHSTQSLLSFCATMSNLSLEKRYLRRPVRTYTHMHTHKHTHTRTNRHMSNAHICIHK